MHTPDSNPDPKGQHSGAPDNAGYEKTDVNISGILVFLAGLTGFVTVFFVFCFVMGKVINQAIEKQDGPADVWHKTVAESNGASNSAFQNMANDPAIRQKQLQQMAAEFPMPRLQPDKGDGAPDLADLHAREDLLLNHYSWVDEKAGIVRIPIERAMQLIAERGLPVAPTVNIPDDKLAHAAMPVVTMPLTDGFARTGYEQQVMETREQGLKLVQPAEKTHAQLVPMK
ncbi:MAG: hypothetical protein ACYC46_04605 [Acidobacteriaceae bacterium]